MELSLPSVLTISCVLIFVGGNSGNTNSRSEEERRMSTIPWLKKYGTTFNYPKLLEKNFKIDTPEEIYKGIVERSINLFWGQQDHLFEVKIRERFINKKTKTDLRKFFEIIQKTDDYIRMQLDALADKFWNPRKDHPPPLKPDVIKYFENAWNKIEKMLDNDLRKLEGVETECNEIRDLMKKAREELPVRFEDIKKMMKTLETAEREMPNCTTTEGTTASEYILSVKYLRYNGTDPKILQ